jgi:hypothetical protein
MSHQQRGGRMPSITTIINRFKESGALIHWAWKTGMAGKDLRAAREMTVGVLVEHMIEDYLLDTSRPLPVVAASDIEKARRCFEGFKRWAADHHIVVHRTQLSLRSQLHRFTGRIDCVASIDGAVVIVDWKVAGGVYLDHLLQLAAYRLLLIESDERFEGTPDKSMLLRIDKGSGEVDPRTWEANTLDQAGEMFLTLRKAYDMDKALKEAV